MKDIFLIYDTSCFYEIVILNYFMAFTGCDVVMCSPNGKPVRTMEGYSVNADMALPDVDINQVRSFTVPGGNYTLVDTEEVRNVLHRLREKRVLMNGICAGVELLDRAGVLESVHSTHSDDSVEYANDDKVITARANAYVDFAIEVARELGLFQDEADLQETIDFWKYGKRM
ncbi:MAG: DJ-1/PfpI family protein [Acetatifactor sp.]